jgi:hypothetical protein
VVLIAYSDFVSSVCFSIMFMSNSSKVVGFFDALQHYMVQCVKFKSYRKKNKNNSKNVEKVNKNTENFTRLYAARPLTHGMLSTNPLF